MKDRPTSNSEGLPTAKLLRRQARKAERKRKRRVDVARPFVEFEQVATRPLARAMRVLAEPLSLLSPRVRQVGSEGRRQERHLSPPQQGGAPIWRRSDGRLTFFNLDPDSRYVLAEEDARPLEVEEIPNALVSRQRDPTLPPRTFSGGVYRNGGHIVPEFLEQDALTQHRWNRRINAPVLERARIEEADSIHDTCVYLGRWSHHFGHFLLESLACAWYLTKADHSIPLVFHSWADRLIVPPFASAILKALNVQPSRIKVVATRDLRVSNLILPSSQFWPGVWASPGMCTIFDHLRERMLKFRLGNGRTPEKVYLSRRAFGAERAAVRPEAVIRNEEEAETFFRGQGYEILQPELLAFEEQVAIVANATHVAGASGSALHMMLFNANPQARLIELRTRPAVNQLLIGAIRGYEGFHVSSLAEGGLPDQMLLDMDVVERAVREIG